MTTEIPQTNPGDILMWPMLKLEYRTEPEKVAALLPPGIEPGAAPNVHLTIYNFPVPDVPEYGILVTVDADYGGEPGMYTLGYGIDQESAIFISRDRNGQPKYPCEVEYWRMMDRVHARCSHQGYTFLEYDGKVTGDLDKGSAFAETEWWIKVSKGVGMMPDASYDFPPHVVRVHSTYETALNQKLEGRLTLRESPWDPIAQRLPVVGEVSARLWSPVFLGREITLHGKLDGDAFLPFADTIGGSRWPGRNGGPIPD